MSKASPARTYGSSTSTEGGGSPARRSTSTLPRSRSSTLNRRKKDLSQDEGSALNDMHRRVSQCGDCMSHTDMYMYMHVGMYACLCVCVPFTTQGTHIVYLSPHKVHTLIFFYNNMCTPVKYIHENLQ